MTEPSRFRLVRKARLPRWLTEGEGELVGYALDVMKDAFMERIFSGLLARFPQQDPDGTPAAPDALAAMGRDRRVVRGIDESAESYATRLKAWLEDRKTGGNPFTLMQKLSEYTGAGCAFRTVDVRGNWYSLAADGTRSLLLAQGNWDWDGDTSGTLWSRFWVIIYPPATLWTEGNEYGDVAAEWGTPSATWGSSATLEEVQTVRALVADWKPAGTRCISIILAFDPASFDPAAPEPDGLWEHWSKEVGGVQVPARLATARYLDGVT